MRCATRVKPDQSDLGRARGVKRDHSTESGITVYGLDSLIRTPSRVCMVRSGHYLRSGQSDQSPAQSLNSLIRAWFRVWIILWYGLDSLNKALSRVCKVWSETFSESGKSDQSQEFQSKSSQSPEKRRHSYTPRDCFFKSTSQFYLINIKHHAKDEILMIVVESKIFLCQTNIFYWKL